MESGWLTTAQFIVSTLTLVVIFWYTLETKKIRGAALAQAEAAHKPCLTVRAEPRAGEEAILEWDGVRGGLVLPQGRIVIQNIGSGPALNVTYALDRLEEIGRDSGSVSKDYLLLIPSGGAIQTHTAFGLIAGGKYELVLTFESLSGRKYETRIIIDRTVLSSYKFKETVRK